MRRIDPIFVTPRSVERDWGRSDLGDWSRLAPAREGSVGEIWLHDAANPAAGRTLGRLLASSSHAMLGDLGRAPPRIRLVVPAVDIAIPSTAPFSFWTLLEPGSPLRRTGERIRAYEGADVQLAGGCVALEVSSAFQPSNDGEDAPSLIRLPPVSRRTRATLAREDALSVEMWTLPPSSRLTPDGETCHVVVALTPGVAIDDRRLRQGEAVFLPGWGRAATIDAERPLAKVLVAYQDRTPTSIWGYAPGPEPMPSVLPRPEPAAPAITAPSCLSAAVAA
jgi:hypothetical protein